MSTKTVEKQRGIERPPAPAEVEPGRFERAVTGDLTADRVADRFYQVENADGETYEVDLESGACTCPDAEYRGDEYVCKHVTRASLVEIFANGVTTQVVARVASHARDHGCRVDSPDCGGPTGGNGLLPCPTCCDAVRSEGVDEFDIWKAVVQDREADR